MGHLLKKAVVTPPLYNVTTSLKQKRKEKKEVISFLYQQLAKVVGSFSSTCWHFMYIKNTHH